MKKWVILTILIVGCFMILPACQQISTLHIIKVINPGSDEAYWEAYWEDYVAEKEISINQLLEDMGKAYRIKFEIALNSQPLVLEDQSDIIIYDGGDITPTELEENYLDIRPELENGALRPLYESMPELYWKSMSVNGHIYNVVREALNKQSGFFVPEEFFDRTDLDIAEQPYSWEEWENIYPTIYEKNDNKPFIAFFVLNTETSQAYNLYCFENAFRMITPYLGISLNGEGSGKVECVYESAYASKVKEWWIRQWEKGYVSDAIEDIHFDTAIFRTDTMRGFCYPFPVTVNGYKLYPFGNTIPLYAEVSGAQKNYTVINKNSADLDMVFQFFNDLVLEEELINEVVSYMLPLSPLVIYMQGYEYGWRWIESDENTRNLMEEYWEMTELAPYSEFVFDKTPVLEQMEAIEKVFQSYNQPGKNDWEEVYPKNNASLEEWSANWDANVAILLEQMYDAGLQDIIDEANRQLGLK